MPRTRNIKPGFFMNEDLAQIDPLGRLLFAGLPCIADREGRLEDRPSRIKVHLLPYDDCDVDGLLSALNASGFICRYEADGCKLIQIVTFVLHQSPHRDEPESSYAPPIEILSSKEGSRLRDQARKGVRGKPRVELFKQPDARGNERKPHSKFPTLWFSELELSSIEKKFERAGLLREFWDHAFMKVEQWFSETTKGLKQYPLSSNHMRRVTDWGLKAALELQRASDSAKLTHGRLR